MKQIFLLLILLVTAAHASDMVEQNIEILIAQSDFTGKVSAMREQGKANAQMFANFLMLEEGAIQSVEAAKKDLKASCKTKSIDLLLNQISDTSATLGSLSVVDTAKLKVLREESELILGKLRSEVIRQCT